MSAKNNATYLCTVNPKDAVTVTFQGRPDVPLVIRTNIDPKRNSPFACLSREDARDFYRRLGEHLGMPAPATDPFRENARFEDVQVGDRVRITYGDGDVIECTVGKVTGYRIDSESGEVFVVERDNDSTITILSRPTPQLPTEPGAVILVDGAPRYLGHDGRWHDEHGGRSASDLAAHEWKLAKVVLA